MQTYNSAPSVRFTWLTEWQNECYIWRGASHITCSSTLLILCHAILLCIGFLTEMAPLRFNKADIVSKLATAMPHQIADLHTVHKPMHYPYCGFHMLTYYPQEFLCYSGKLCAIGWVSMAWSQKSNSRIVGFFYILKTGIFWSILRCVSISSNYPGQPVGR